MRAELTDTLRIYSDILKNSSNRLNKSIKDYLFCPITNYKDDNFECGFFIQNLVTSESKSHTMICNNEATIFEFRFFFINLLGDIMEEYRNISEEIYKEGYNQEVKLRRGYE